ncbi:putative envelope ADP TP carrier protein [Nymphaea thermarum]|nr:putative envelope ADP TP carrier protein [Nymphaea thermarum]
MEPAIGYKWPMPKSSLLTTSDDLSSESSSLNCTDPVKKYLPAKYQNRPESSLATALASAAPATLMCYPLLDTVRRQMQMKDSPYKSVLEAFPEKLPKNNFVKLVYNSYYICHFVLNSTRSIIDNKPEAIYKTFLFGDNLGSVQEVAKNLTISWRRGLRNANVEDSDSRGPPPGIPYMSGGTATSTFRLDAGAVTTVVKPSEGRVFTSRRPERNGPAFIRSLPEPELGGKDGTWIGRERGAIVIKGIRSEWITTEIRRRAPWSVGLPAFSLPLFVYIGFNKMRCTTIQGPAILGLSSSSLSLRRV